MREIQVLTKPESLRLSVHSIWHCVGCKGKRGEGNVLSVVLRVKPESLRLSVHSIWHCVGFEREARRGLRTFSGIACNH